jgi:Tol biopolymer transport system component
VDSPVWEYDSANNYLRKIEAFQGRWFRWSPDGRKIAFLKGNDLFLANNDGNHQERIYSFKKVPGSCNWSPEGNKLRVCCAPEGADYSVIWEINSDGTGFHQVLPRWNARQERADWVFNGTYSFFFSDLNLKRGEMEFWSLNEKTVLFHKRRWEPVQLSSGPVLFSWPAASRTSPKIFAIGSSRLGEMMRCELKTGRRVPFLDGISADCLDFSRDGEWVAYVTYPERELWRARSNGSQKLKLTTKPHMSYVPR